MKAGVKACSEAVSDQLVSCELAMNWVFQLYYFFVIIYRKSVLLYLKLLV